MAKQLASLPRLRDEANLGPWARQLVDYLESLFIGGLGTEMGGGGGGGGAPTGPAGGDLTGSYPNPFIANGAVGDAQITDVAWGKITGVPDALNVAYRHVQTTAATVWSISHPLSFRPNVAAVDSTGREMIPGAVDYLDAATIQLTFSAAVGGEAYLS